MVGRRGSVGSEQQQADAFVYLCISAYATEPDHVGRVVFMRMELFAARPCDAA